MNFGGSSIARLTPPLANVGLALTWAAIAPTAGASAAGTLAGTGGIGVVKLTLPTTSYLIDER